MAHLSRQTVNYIGAMPLGEIWQPDMIFSSLKLEPTGRHLSDEILNLIFVSKLMYFDSNSLISILKDPGPTYNKAALPETTGAWPSLLTNIRLVWILNLNFEFFSFNICVTRPQWVSEVMSIPVASIISLNTVEIAREKRR